MIPHEQVHAGRVRFLVLLGRVVSTHFRRRVLQERGAAGGGALNPALHLRVALGELAPAGNGLAVAVHHEQEGAALVGGFKYPCFQSTKSSRLCKRRATS